MKTALWMIGKTDAEYLKKGISIYEKRIGRYLKFEQRVFLDVKTGKKPDYKRIKQQEAALILPKLDKGDCLILLDEQGKQYDSVHFANFFEQKLLASHRQIIFMIGGAYGFSEEMYSRANHSISLSTMTFSHQMVRLIFLEQLYRAMTILNNEPYHHA